MLDYFLLYLAGPERNKLRVRDPERYGWNPRELLSLVVSETKPTRRNRATGSGCYAREKSIRTHDTHRSIRLI
jgi:hypothetical protein